jgi:uncharacterized protein
LHIRDQPDDAMAACTEEWQMGTAATARIAVGPTWINGVYKRRREVRHPLIGALLGLVALLLVGTNVLALDAVQDAGNMFSPQARQTATDKINQIQRDTGKTVLVRTVPSLNGQDVLAAADQVFRQASTNGVLIFAAKADQKLAIKVGDETRALISQSEEAAIRDQMLAAFRSNKFDDGLTAGIDRIGNDLRAGARTNTGSSRTAPATQAKQGGGFPWLLLILIAAVGIGLAIFLARRSRNRVSPIGDGYGPGAGSGYAPGSGAPYGQGYGPGYGPNYGGGGGGGGFGRSVVGGAVGGIGGAILGNAIYDHFRDRDDDRNDGGDPASVESGNDYGQVSDSPADVGSWGGDDPGSAGDWGSSDTGSAGDWSSGDSGGDSGGGDSSG